MRATNQRIGFKQSKRILLDQTQIIKRMGTLTHSIFHHFFILWISYTILSFHQTFSFHSPLLLLLLPLTFFFFLLLIFEFSFWHNTFQTPKLISWSIWGSTISLFPTTFVDIFLLQPKLISFDNMVCFSTFYSLLTLTRFTLFKPWGNVNIVFLKW